MHFKKLLALLVSAALMLSLLAGCGNGESAVQALLKLLDGRYPNISIEIDHDLEADLRQAIRKAEAENAGDDAAVIRAALETALGSTITFRYLGDGQQGDTTFDLVFYAGSDPDKAAQAAYSQWNLVFANVPDDGKYDTALAMVETENGVWMLVKATVEKAGTPDKPDKDDDEPDEQEPQEPEKDPYTDNGDNSYTINTEDGLQQLVEDLDWPADDAILSADITLDCDVDLQGVDWTPIGTSSQRSYTGTFDGDGHKILNLNVNTSGQYRGLFGYIKGATVKHLTLEAPAVSCSSYNGYAGGVAAYMQNSTIENCQVSGGSISCTDDTSTAGGIVGYVHIHYTETDNNVVKNCQVSGVTISAQNAGGVAGNTSGKNSRIENCEVSGCNITSNVSDGVMSYVGGIAGSNSSTVKNCLAQKNTINADGNGRAGGVVGWTTNPEGSTVSCGSVSNRLQATYAAGGVVGYMNAGGSVTACFSANDNITGLVEDSHTGGVVGYSAGCAATKCYWFGTTTDGVGDGSGTNDTHQVGTGEITWSTVADAMGDYWQDNGPENYPTLKDQ